MIHYDSPHLPVGMYSAQIRSSRRWSVQRINSAQQATQTCHLQLPTPTDWKAVEPRLHFVIFP
jgi:hypothetical protein